MSSSSSSSRAVDPLEEGFDEPRVTLNEDFENVVVVDGLPVVKVSKYPKLIAWLQKEFASCGQIVEEGLYLPIDDEKQTTVGVAFIEFETPEQARNALRKDYKPMDVKHRIRVNLYGDIEALQSLPEEFVAKEDDYQNIDNTRDWLLDDLMRDQYLVRHADETEIWWNDPETKWNENSRELVNDGSVHKAEGKHWTDELATWSRLGTFLVTFHKPGIALWGGPKFERVGRFQHDAVMRIEFSPQENYFVTGNQRHGDPRCFVVWDVRTGRELRSFDSGVQGGDVWPQFKWSHDDKYIARISKNKQGKDVISVYELPAMTLLDKKSFVIDTVQSFEWSPTENVISYWVPEGNNTPATVSLVAVPSRQIIREKHLYKVSKLTLHWQDNGDYLCVKMDRHISRKQTATSFEVFRIRGKNIPVETFEIPDTVHEVQFEPSGNRMAIVHEDRVMSVSVYVLRRKKCELLGTFEGRSVNRLFWSPNGHHLVLAGLGAPFNGVLEFVDVDKMETVASHEHYLCNHVQWDPTGRFLITAVIQPFYQGRAPTLENGYKVWAYDPKQEDVPVWLPVTEVNLPDSYSVEWRPRPPPVLSRGEVRRVRDSIKSKYYEKFVAVDKEREVMRLGERAQRRYHLMQEWRRFLDDNKQRQKSIAKQREALWAGVNKGDETVEVEVEEMIVLSEREVPLTEDDFDDDEEQDDED